MNLFRPEERCPNWTGFYPKFEEQLKPLSYRLERFSRERHRSRIRSDFISWPAAHPR
jgi:hypothetical protein